MANLTMLTGFLGKDPEHKTLQVGAEVVRLSVATDDGYKDKTSGEWVSKTNWHNVICWRGAATKAKSLRKGEKVFVRGRNTSRTWQTEAGENRHVYEVEAFEVEKIDYEKKTASNPMPSDIQQKSQSISDSANTGLSGTGADDLPF